MMYAVFDKYIIDPIRIKYKHLFNLTFCDDRYIAGNTKAVAAFFHESEAALASVGAIYRADKCHIYYHPNNPYNLTQLFPKQINSDDDRNNFHPNFNIKILGSYVGSNEYIKSNVQKQSDAVQKAIESTACLSDTQCANLLLLNCFDSCRVTY